MLKIIKSDLTQKTVISIPKNTRSRTHLAAGFMLSAAMLLVGTACGNKGDLYIPIDERTLQELEQAEKDIEEAARKKREAQSREQQPPDESDQSQSDQN